MSPLVLYLQHNHRSLIKAQPVTSRFHQGVQVKTQGFNKILCHHSFCVFATAGEELLTFKAFPPFQLATAAWAVRDGLQRNTKTFNFFLRGDGLRLTTTNLEK